MPPPPAPERAEYGELYDAVARLPERLRVAVILYYFRDMDVAAGGALAILLIHQRRSLFSWR